VPEIKGDSNDDLVDFEDEDDDNDETKNHVHNKMNFTD
jgi:hypothetical protein